MARVENIEQGSLEWHEHRATHRNASEASIIMDCAPKYWGMTKRKLWEQKQGLIGSNVSADNPAIMHGNNLEAAALACVANKLNAQLEPAVFVDGEYSASLDGWGHLADGRSVKVEIKCPWKGEDSQVWKMAADGDVAEYYHWQMVHQDYVEETHESYFFVYISDEKNILIPHLTGDDEVVRLLDAWDEFCAEEPAPDWVERSDEKIKDLVYRHKQLLADKKMIDDHLKKAEAALKAEAGDDNVIAFGCKIQTVERVGSVDYKKVPQLDGVDLEQYRKPSSTYQRISYEKETNRA